MFPYKDNFQALIEKPLNESFRKLKYSKDQLEEYLVKKYEIHKKYEAKIAFPIIEVDFIYEDGKHHILFLDRFNGMKYSGFKRDRTQHTLIILTDTLEWIRSNNLGSLLPPHNFKMHFDVSDSYLWDSDGYPIFVHAKPSNMTLPLYPDYTYFRITFIPGGRMYNWDQTKEIFKEYREYKPPIIKKIFFRGVDSTSNPHGGDNSNIRNKLKELSLRDPKTEIRVFPQSETAKRATPLYEDCGFETYLDLPGNFPWSFRKKFLYLTGGDVIYIKSLWESKGKWKDSCGWIQFIDQVLILYPTTEIEFIYTLKEDNTDKVVELYDKIKKTPRLEENLIKRRLERIEMLNTSRLYQYITRMIMLSSGL